METTQTLSTTERLHQFIAMVYAVMGAGLGLSAIIAYIVANYYMLPSPQDSIFANPLVMTGLLIAQVIVVLVLSFAVLRMSPVIALITFLAYSALVGLTFSSLFVVYAETSITLTFLITAATFGVMALYGYFTQSDLSSIRSYINMAVIGLIIALLINLWWRNPLFDLLLSGAGVLLFTILTAVDMQQIKNIGMQLMIYEHAPVYQVAVMGALTLYLNFINLFLFLLRFTGRERR